MSNYRDKYQTRPFGLFGGKQVDPGSTAPTQYRYYAIRACNGDVTVSITAGPDWADDLTDLVIQQDQIFEGNIAGFSVSSSTGAGSFAYGYIER